MKKLFATLISLVLACHSLSAQFAPNSVLAQGQWASVSVEASGVYKITYRQLEALGFSPASLNPDRLQVYGFGGILPQGNSQPRPDDLPQIPAWVSGGGDGRFDTGDALVFYAQGPHERSYRQGNQWFHKRNPYSDKAYYYIHLGQEPGKSLPAYAQPSQEPTQTLSIFEEQAWIEPEEVSLLGSGREWYSQPFGLDSEQAHTIEAAGWQPGSLQIQMQALGRSRQAGAFQLELNGEPIGELPFAGTAISTYSIWGKLAEGSYEKQVPSPPSQMEITLRFLRNSNEDKGYLDYLRIQYLRKLALYGSQTAFRHRANGLEAVLYEWESLPSDAQVWHISKAALPESVELRREGNKASFKAISGQELLGGEANAAIIPEFVAFRVSSLPEPTLEGELENQDLHALPPVNLLLLSPKKLRPQAERLAQFRAENDGISTQVVEVEQVYREFGSGQPSPTALRDFIRSLYLKNAGGSQELKYVLLLGEATYDYRNILFGQDITVPIYQSRNSHHPLLTYSSDDYFGFMGASEGEWVESGVGLNSHFLDLGVGRLPAPDLESGRIMVDKLIRYEEAPEAVGDWRQRLLFTADDGDSNLHQRDADSLARMTERMYSAYHAQRLFVDDYEQVNAGDGKRSPEAKKEMERVIEQGALLVNFTGHGSETGWTSENIMDNPLAVGLQNRYRLPLFVTATCEFGRYDNPSRDSGAELLLKNEQGGAIGLLTTTRPVLSFSNFRVNRAFYEACFEPLPNGEMPRLGDVIRRTKNSSLNGVNNRNFALLGDPSMRLAYPSGKVEASALNGLPIEGLDTLSALEQVEVTAQVLDNAGSPDPSFNGWAKVTVYDRPAKRQTRGDGEENTPMTYKAYVHKLFEGTVEVVDGVFTAAFTVPKDIAYDYGMGKMIFYAREKAGLRDAQGFLDVRIGGSASGLGDESAPEMTAWLESAEFQLGDEVSRQPLLYLRLSDENGFNLTGKGVGHSITAVIDGDPSLTYTLNKYFVLDTGKYDAGELYFSVPDPLAVGEHTLRLGASDTYNNRANMELSFVVRKKIRLEGLVAYPNPFTDALNLRFRQDRAGDDLDVQLFLYGLDGRELGRYSETLYRASTQVDLRWAGLREQGAPLRPGLYLLKLRLTSRSDGEVVEGVIRVVR